MEIEVICCAALCFQRHDGRPPQVAVNFSGRKVVQRCEARKIARFDLAATAHEVLGLAGKLRPKESLNSEPFANRLNAKVHERFFYQTYSRIEVGNGDRKSTRLNSSHVAISYAVFCLK